MLGLFAPLPYISCATSISDTPSLLLTPPLCPTGRLGGVPPDSSARLLRPRTGTSGAGGRVLPVVCEP